MVGNDQTSMRILLVPFAFDPKLCKTQQLDGTYQRSESEADPAPHLSHPTLAIPHCNQGPGQDRGYRHQGQQPETRETKAGPDTSPPG